MNSGHAKMADWGFAHLKKIQPARIAELGCGGGRNAGELLKKYPEARVTAIDYSPLSVEQATEYNRAMIDAGRCEVLQNDVSALTLETIYFWGDLKKCFSQVMGILKTGGIFMIVNESDGNDKTSLRFEKIIDGMKCYTAEEIQTALKAAGFSAVKADHHPSKPWITVIAKK